MSMAFAAARRPLARAVAALVGIVALVTAASWHATAAAQPYPPQQSCSVSTSDTNVTTGANLHVVGSGFPARADVSLRLQPASVPLATVHTGADGSFTRTVTVASSAKGEQTIVASSGSETCQFDPSRSGGFGVDAAHTSRVGGLAYTGFAALTVACIAVALLGAGLIFIAIGRRRV